MLDVNIGRVQFNIMTRDKHHVTGTSFWIAAGKCD